MEQWLNGWGLEVVLWFQSWRTPLIASLAIIFHEATSETIYLLLVPFIYLCWDAQFGRRLTLFFAFGAWLNGFLKEWWKLPRPFQASSLVENPIDEVGYGMPSGHAQHSVSFWGVVALRARRDWFTALVLAFIVLTAISRVVLGLHFPQDVLVGLVIGTILLGLYIWLERRVSAWLTTRTLLEQIGLVVGISAVMFVAYPVLIQPSSPQGLEAPITAAAIFRGAGIGFALEWRLVRFALSAVWWRRAISYALCVAVLVGLRFGLGALFDMISGEDSVSTLAIVLRVVRYALIGLWVAAGAPWLSLKLKLADREIN